MFSGQTIAQVATLEPFDYVILHVGTNDLDNRAPHDDIISDFGNLIGICQDKKPSIQITVSAILPRPVDIKIADNFRRKVDYYLQKNVSKSMRFKCMCSYKPFMRAGQVRRELFAKRDGGLHLNTAGTNALTRFLIRVISTLLRSSFDLVTSVFRHHINVHI